MTLKRIAFIILAVSASLWSCRGDKTLEKHYDWRANMVSMKDSIHEIKPDLLFGESWVYIVNDYLVLCEYHPNGDKAVHLLNKNTFKYITSTAITGEGPGEVTRPGLIGVNQKDREFWLCDAGRQVLYCFPIDSVLNNPLYKPSRKADQFRKLFIERFSFLNDTTALGIGVGMKDDTYQFQMVRSNFKTNIIEPYGYMHLASSGRFQSNAFFAMSVQQGFYINCYMFSDLITICDLQGNLKCNVYGVGWKDSRQGREHDRNGYYGYAHTCENYIVVAYNGGKDIVYDKNQRPMGNQDNKLVILDSEGNYIKTIEVGGKFYNYCIDEENGRAIFFFLDRENPLGYINLNLPKS